MIPLKDENRSSSAPIVTIGLILVNVAVFIYQYFLGHAGFEAYVWAYGLTPGALFGSLDLAEKARGLIAVPEYIKIISSMFMHGGFLHIIMNMWVLWIFGDNVEDAMGKVKFLLFYLICGIIAAASHAFFNQGSQVPLVGASGAIAGVMGAYLILYPGARVVTLFWFFIFIRVIRVPAFLFLGFWFLLQLLYSPTPGPVAYLAHVGGFVAGMLLVFLFTSRKKGFRIIRVR